MVPHDPLTLIGTALVAMTVVMLVLWAVQLHGRNASLADVGWCTGLVGVVTWYGTAVSGDPGRRGLVITMIAVYGLRLGSYILLHRVIGKTEDPRYQYMRRWLGRREQLGVLAYFLLQAPAVALFSLPPLAVMQNPRPTFSLWELAGVLVWLVAVVGESAADWQLAHFRAKSWNRNRVCRDGLWYYSRHPNYFFEWLQWWAYVLMAVGTPGWLVAWIGPVVMGVALLKVTGIPLAERQAVITRGDDYRAYQRTTNAFFPWFPKRQ
jgi:steroid 5-alpha reductase family enzyme